MPPAGWRRCEAAPVLRAMPMRCWPNGTPLPSPATTWCSCQTEVLTARRGGFSTACERERRRKTEVISPIAIAQALDRTEEHTSELQSLTRISYAVFYLKTKSKKHSTHHLYEDVSSATYTTPDNHEHTYNN